MNTGAAIGVFDSGVGGLTVVRALRDALPLEHLYYLGDTARVPYGNKAPETVRRYSLNCSRFLVDRGVKALVLACNTASAFGFNAVAEALDPLPVIDVIRPVAELAAAHTTTGVIGVLGTRGTVSSQAYLREITRLSPRAQVVQQSCPLFVPLAEEGWTDGEIAQRVAERYLAPFAATDVDTIILGCTHYPLLRRTIQGVLDRLLGRPITLLDSARATAMRLRAVLDAQGLRVEDGEPTPVHGFVTDDAGRFAAMSEQFLGHALDTVEHIDL